jgi:hypothetical protein
MFIHFCFPLGLMLYMRNEKLAVPEPLHIYLKKMKDNWEVLESDDFATFSATI